ncbi:uncharacterized protein FRV6_16465 [Fusarium oxysporum]|uniref:Uncharacterized protein n=1 Tax=Fusarium oxysporum TaxID=5507 RepID=A0A2H3TUR2_FUSOX|nr:uncharacterized protein FRV6_16465 [Fusarium oxysporum]
MSITSIKESKNNS